MSESTNKRFRYDTGCIIDNQTGTVLTEIQIRNKLNQLHDENKELQVQLNFIRDQSNSFKRKVIEKNNSIGILKKQLDSEHQMLDNAIRTERTNIGKSVLKQLRDKIQ